MAKCGRDVRTAQRDAAGRQSEICVRQAVLRFARRSDRRLRGRAWTGNTVAAMDSFNAPTEQHADLPAGTGRRTVL
jgi:hypothetical protein